VRYFVTAILVAVLSTASAQNPVNSQQLPDSFQVQQSPMTIQIQPDPITYRRVQPIQQYQPYLQQQQSPTAAPRYELIIVPQRFGLFGLRMRYSPMWLIR
jgi:hypothetical protein